MSIITMLEIGQSVNEGTVIRWLKALGDSASVNEPHSPAVGVLREINVRGNETVMVAVPFGRIGDSAAGETPIVKRVAVGTATQTATAVPASARMPSLPTYINKGYGLWSSHGASKRRSSPS